MSEPICYEPDGITPCRGERVCHEPRRRHTAGYVKMNGAWIERHPPLRGQECWFYHRLLQTDVPRATEEPF